jgi:hypothetical protein
MVTHDLSLHTVCDRIAVLANGKVITAGPIPNLRVGASLGEVVFPRQALARRRGATCLLPKGTGIRTRSCAKSA